MINRFIVAVAAITVLSTGGSPAVWAEPTPSPEELLSGELLGAADDSTTPVTAGAVLALSDEMRQFLKENVNPGATDVFKLQQLIDAIMGTATFGLEYDENTRSAAETFRLQLGNCLSESRS